MTDREFLFSRRSEIRRPDEGLSYESVPVRVKDGLLNLLDTLTLTTGARQALAKLVYTRLDRRYAPNDWQLELLISGSAWDEFCDICESIWSELGGLDVEGPEADYFSNELNALFLRHFFGYEMREGRIEQVGAHVHEQTIAEARGILRDPDLSGPNDQYQKAIAFFNRRPEPDLENCVKEAVSAVEGTARVLMGHHSLTLSDALKRLKAERDVHPTLVILLEKLYAYRGDAEGVGHALTGDKEVRFEDAEFALAVSASAIVYLARLYGRGVE